MNPVLEALDGFVFSRSYILCINTDRRRVEDLVPGDYIGFIHETQGRVGRVQFHAECEGLRIIVMGLYRTDHNFEFEPVLDFGCPHSEQFVVTVPTGDIGFGQSWVLLRQTEFDDAERAIAEDEAYRLLLGL
jgi:hypothetical protein